jgi:predicted deacylase
MTKYLEINGIEIKPGERKQFSINIARLYDFTEMGMPVEVIRGTEHGPVLFASAAIHGDEINGVEIIRRVLNMPIMREIRGTFIAVPIVNVFGFNDKTRYLPDRRDLNRSFPGNAEGSLASQIAHTFMKQIVEKSTHGIDLHTGAWHRSNLSQIRCNVDDVEQIRLAKSFGVPVIINSSLRDGSLREAASEKNIPCLLFEGGESLRFSERVIRTGVNGILNYMSAIGMIDRTKKLQNPNAFIARSSSWVRAPQSGIHVRLRKLGDYVEEGDILGEISNAFGKGKANVLAHISGLIIGNSILPLANRGDALFHIASLEDKPTQKELMDNLNMEMFDPVNQGEMIDVLKHAFDKNAEE